MGGARWGAVARLGRRHRRGLAGASAAVAVIGMGMAIRPPPPATEPLVVAAGDMAPGHRLAQADLTIAPVPVGGRPPGTSVDPGELLGRVLAAPVARGEAISSMRLVSPAGWPGPAGTTPVPVRFSDPGAGRMLAAGLRVDVLAATGPALEAPGADAAPASLIAEDVLVLAVLGTEDEGTAAPLLADAPDAPLVVLAASRAQALAIAGAQADGHLSFAFAAVPP